MAEYAAAIPPYGRMVRTQLVGRNSAAYCADRLTELAEYAPLFRPTRCSARDGSRLSTLDLAPGEFALLTGPEGEAWVAAASSLRLPVSVRVFPVGAASLVDESGICLARAGVMNDGAVLVRPDGFIAWRAKQSKPDAATVLESVLLSLLGSAPARD